jgi:heterodisulfide reductase subunit A
MDILGDLLKSVENSPRIKVMLESEVEEVDGHAGDFRVKVRQRESLRELEVGAAVIAIGTDLLIPHGYYNYGKNKKIITQQGMEELLRGDFDAKSVVMIQCIGAREEKRPYCSRVCCTEAIKNAIYIKKRKPETEVFVLYKDIRTYGIWETRYNVARSLGVLFIRYTDEDKPVVDPETLTVTVPELLMNKRLTIHPDLIVLSSAMIPNEENNTKISRLFKVPLDQEGFFQEAHVKLRPVDFATDGVFVCGTAHYPKMIYESIAQASAVASRVTTFLSAGQAASEGIPSRVDREKCLGCGLCESICPFHAIKLGDDGIAQIAGTCKGCGACAASCPAKAIETPHFTDQQLVAQIDSARAVA